MAVQTVEPIPKSQPDNSKLNTFTGHTVTVTKHTAPRGSVGQMVVTTQPMRLPQILELMTTLPLANGPGFYKFTVSDTGGTGDDVWMVKLGPDFPEAPQMANVIPMGPSGFSGQPPTGEGVVHLGHGYFYNAELGTLTTPWKSVHNWKQGESMPTQPTPASQQPTANPWWSNLQQMQNPAMPFGAGWGGYPAVNDSTETRMREMELRFAEEKRQLEAKLLEEKRQREADENRAEIRRIAEEAQKRSEAQAAQFALLVKELTAKPAGPSETEQRLERELAEQRRRTEEREREERLRAEMKAVQENTERLVREMSKDKTDPMLPMLLQMFTTMQQQAQKSVEAIQASTSASSSAAERSTQQLLTQLSSSVMSPMQLVQLMQSAKGDGAEAARLMVQSTKELMDMQKDVYSQLLDVAGQSGQPPWVGLVQEAMSKVGAIGQAIAEKQQQLPPPPPPQRMAPQQQRVAPPPQARAIPPQAQPTGPATAAQVRDQVAAQVPHLVPVPAEVIHAAPMNGAAPVTQPALQTPQVPQAAAAPAARTPSRRKPQKHRRNGRRTRTQVTQPPADPKRGYTVAEMHVLPAEVVREGSSAYPDDVFFGALLANVLQLRVASLPPKTVAGYILQARAAALQQGIMSMAIELLLAEQLEVLVERLFPDAPEEYRDGVAQALEEAISAESVESGAEGGAATDDDDDDEEGDEEGDDAQA